MLNLLPGAWSRCSSGSVMIPSHEVTTLVVYLGSAHLYLLYLYITSANAPGTSYESCTAPEVPRKTPEDAAGHVRPTTCDGCFGPSGDLSKRCEQVGVIEKLIL